MDLQTELREQQRLWAKRAQCHRELEREGPQRQRMIAAAEAIAIAIKIYASLHEEETRCALIATPQA